MNRTHWRNLAEERVLDARLLLQGGRWGAAYYLAGYAVEAGLKSCVLAYVENQNADVIFREKKFSESCWTHNLRLLVKLAGLQAVLDAEGDGNPRLRINWAHVARWNETSRYQPATESEARRLFEAVTDFQNGVLPWIKIHW